MPQPIVFFDIAGPDARALREFYAAALDWSVGEPGRLDVPVTSPLTGAIREDPAEKRLYVGVPDVAAALERIAELGGSVDAPRFEVPGVVILGLFRDPAGNPMGLVEMEGDEVKIP
jgi:hypothetical protein